MAHNAPGKHFRKGLTLAQLFTMFPDDQAHRIRKAWAAGESFEPLDTLEQIGSVVEGSVGKRLRCSDLIAA